MKIRQDLPLFVFIALFALIPLSTIPGLFSFIGVLLGVLTLVLIVVLVLSWRSGPTM